MTFRNKKNKLKIFIIQWNLIINFKIILNNYLQGILQGIVCPSVFLRSNHKQLEIQIIKEIFLILKWVIQTVG